MQTQAGSPVVDSRSFIAAIRGNNLAAVRGHAESGRFAPGVLQQAMNLAAFCGHRRLLGYFFNLKQNGVYEFLDTAASLEAAAAAGKVQGVVDLISFGADLHCDEDFPYYLALNHNHPVTSFYLQLAGVNLLRNEHALRSAYRRGWRELVLDICALHTQAPTPRAALPWSVRQGKVRVALGALLAGADPCENDSELLFSAIANGQDEMVRILAEHGADVLARGERILLDTAKASHRGSTLRLVYGLYRKAQDEPCVLLAGSGGRTQALKTVEGRAEFSAGSRPVAAPTGSPRVVPTLVPWGRGWRQASERAGRA